MKKVLLVESDYERAMAVVHKLMDTENFEYAVDHCRDGADAIGKLCPNNSTYSAAVIADKLPSMPGMDLVRRIRVFDKKLGIVVMTSDPEKVEQESDDLDIMAAVDYRNHNGLLLEMVGNAVEMTEMPDETRASIETDLHTQTVHMNRLRDDS